MPEKKKVLNSKESIYVVIQDMIKEKTGKNIGRSGGMELFNTVVENFFVAAVSDKSFRFNGGFGAFHVKHYGAGSRTIPSGRTIEFGERSKLRYEEGVVVQALVANGGDLEAAKADRKSSAPSTKGTTTSTVKAAEPEAENTDEQSEVDLD